MAPSTVYKHNYEGVDLGEGRLVLPKRVTATTGGRAWFARAWMHILNFHHEEAFECFKRCTEVDAQCAMALWGIGERLARIGSSTMKLQQYTFLVLVVQDTNDTNKLNKRFS